MERHEDDATCAVREVFEETGLRVEYVASLGNTFDNFVTAKKGPMNWNTHWVLTKMVDASAEPAVCIQCYLWYLTFFLEILQLC